jgi:hypothetical protein
MDAQRTIATFRSGSEGRSSSPAAAIACQASGTCPQSISCALGTTVSAHSRPRRLDFELAHAIPSSCLRSGRGASFDAADNPRAGYRTPWLAVL